MSMDVQITQTFIGQHFSWDRVSEAKLELIENNRESAMRVINDPDRFPNAQFDYLKTLVIEIDAFMAQYGTLLGQFA